ncbi:MAG: hypothetical protein NWE94_00570 [Candidatus Bathyarchaeota archaeon]|nr:hypothetical protein [Candidatus Bathyarchaeota archaeon]
MDKRSKLKPDFNEVLLEAINEALSSLGENVAKSIYFHVEKTFNIKPWEIPKRIKEFSNALEQIFGLGARTLEILCMQKLHNKIQVTCKWPKYEWPLSKWIAPELTFQEYVNLMRQNYEKAHTCDPQMGVFMHEYKELQK